ncbi:MAG: hypothetical protein U5J62_11215 [Desulfurivibrio sp.]|nr:hypothetical protein [Desulfurivibrio sp.]
MAIRTPGNPDRRLYVAEENGDPVGMLQRILRMVYGIVMDGILEQEGGSGETDGCCTGKRNLRTNKSRSKNRKNTSSARIAEHAGTGFERETDGILHYKRAALG